MKNEERLQQPSPKDGHSIMFQNNHRPAFIMSIRSEVISFLCLAFVPVFRLGGEHSSQMINYRLCKGLFLMSSNVEKHIVVSHDVSPAVISNDSQTRCSRATHVVLYQPFDVYSFRQSHKRKFASGGGAKGMEKEL